MVLEQWDSHNEPYPLLHTISKWIRDLLNIKAKIIKRQEEDIGKRPHDLGEGQDLLEKKQSMHLGERIW